MAVGTGDPMIPYSSWCDGHRLDLEYGMAPEAPRITLLVDDEPVATFDDWSEVW
ncbi:hypothetical protein AB0L85_15315 [Streptomyces sp. NPDC052051]|uniref:hypothetical protein n=1 Tax=Streptomyces sp. NPDC052051 TaxID=3154649 RepID=UPI00343803E7